MTIKNEKPVEMVLNSTCKSSCLLVTKIFNKFGVLFAAIRDCVFLRIIAKEPLKRTSRKHGTFQWELMNRYSEELVRRASKERLAQRGYDVAGGDIRDNSLSVADSGSSRTSQMTNTTSKGRWFTPGGTVFYCSKYKDSGAWGMFNSDGTRLSDGLHHPGYPGNAKARKWVIAMVKAAENLSEVEDSVVSPNYDRIDFTYHLKTPNSNDDAHDLFVVILIFTGHL